jgi:hypothetical protein
VNKQRDPTPEEIEEMIAPLREQKRLRGELTRTGNTARIVSIHGGQHRKYYNYNRNEGVPLHADF